MPLDAGALPFAQIVDAAPDGMLVADQHGVLVLVNAEATRMFGYARSELLGQPIEILVPAAVRARHPEHVARFQAAPKLRPMGSGLDLQGQRRDGSQFPVEISLSPILHDGERLVVAVIRDVTERRQIADALRSASAAKSEFLSSMSHELRTPLNAVLGFAQLLQLDRKEPLSERQQERLRHVLRGGEHLLRLIDDVLDLARIEAGRVTMSCEPVTLGDVLHDVVTTLEPMATHAQVQLRLADLPADLPLVFADRTRLAQILMNFGSNAIKYGQPGGHATLEAHATADHVRLTVIDDGFGIPADKHDRLFEPFQRAGQETGPIEGTGIGLVISKRLAALMQGRVGFSSEVGVGSRFWVEVPVFHATEAKRPVPAPPPVVPSALVASGARWKVVYVEDNPSNIAFMRDLLGELETIELRVAPTAEIGLDLIRTYQPAMVIMDINLPGMNGFDAARQLRTWPETRAIPIVGLSAAALVKDTARAQAGGFDRYLTKPVRVAELLAVLEELLASR